MEGKRFVKDKRFFTVLVIGIVVISMGAVCLMGLMFGMSPVGSVLFGLAAGVGGGIYGAYAIATFGKPGRSDGQKSA